jgi:hypothetical protein
MKLGEMIDRMYEIKLEKAELNKLVQALTDESDKIQAEVLARLQEEEMDSAKSKRASATVSKSIVPSVTDWDAFGNYIISTGDLFLLEKRPSVTAYRDLLQAGESIPGVEPFTKVTLALRKI